jgi:molecular chaperone GrpE
MVRDKHNRPEDPASMGAGDSPLDLSPPNVEEVQPPAPGIVAPPEEPVGAAESATTAALDQELEALRRDLKDASDRHLRLAAEFDNYRKRMERERSEAWARAQGELAARLLDVMDDLERVAHHGDTSNAAALLQGVQLVEKKLRTVLGAAGLEEIDAENASFDPNSMEAVAMVPAESPEDDDVVSDVFQRGYRFKGQLLRPARVRVKKHH